MSASAAASLPGPPLPADTLPALLDLLPTGVVYALPLPAAPGTAPDLTLAYLNPAAQRLLGLPAQPGTTLAQHWSVSVAAALLVRLAAAPAADAAPLAFALPLPADPAAPPLAGRARRHGPGLLLTLEAPATAPAAAPPAPAEVPGQVLAELGRLFGPLPMPFTLFKGPQLVVEYANDMLGQLLGRPVAALLGRPVFAAVPDLGGQGLEELLTATVTQGTPFDLTEVRVEFVRAPGRPPELGYFNLSYRPRYDAAGNIEGVLGLGVDVTEQVRARQRLEQLNEELELRVTARSAETRAALFEAEQQREQAATQQRALGQILGQVPAAIATLTGPEHRFAFFNDLYQQLVGHRAVLGRPVDQALPEVREQGFIALLDQVYATGQPFVGTETAVLLHGDGAAAPEQLYVDLIYQPLFDSQQRVTGILAFILDVTERVRSRKQAETLQAALLGVAKRQAQERQDLLDLFRQAPVAVVLLREPDHRIDYHNPAFEELFPPDDWAGPVRNHTLEAVYPRIRAAGLSQLLDQVYATGEGQLVPELPLAVLQPGSPRYVTLVYQAYREQGRIAGVAAFAYDVTAPVLDRLAREAAQAELRSIIEQAPVATAFMRGPGLVIELANDAIATIWGRSPAQVLGRPYAEALPEVAAQGYPQLMAGVMATGVPAHFSETPVQLRRADTGELAEGYYNFSLNPVFDAQRRAVGILSMGVEVTAQVQARRQVETQQQELQRIFEQAPVAICVYRGPDYVLEFANPPLARLLGKTPAEVEGRPLMELAPEMRSQGLGELLDQVYATGQPFVAQEMALTIVRGQGPELGYYNFVYQPLFDARGRVDGVICVAADVTAQVQARAQVQALNDDLSAANTDLTRANADLDTFVYTASHDLKSPITNIEGLLAALREHLPPLAGLDPTVTEVLRMMDDAVARFRQTLTDLTDVGRLQSDLLAEPPAPIALPELVEAVYLDLLPELLAAGLQLDLALDLCPTVTAPARTLRSVLYNLLSNAAKYRDPARPLRVTVRCAVAEGWMELAVADNGLGLTSAQQASLFQMYRRLHTHVPGSGVGLYMVKKLVENAGGAVAVASEVGAGSTFTVRLPVG
ncbi:PAS domain-containing protein [Hymenobacter sp. ASUV-10]|uniref:histidine kinase n=1 Tax=Hymenobacter aranciens TaxID=3063996 RepID=A0ABT9BD20_9BACT|nr:PAS domain-containing protein [Hymenobacter sp. ASUV-10]MDO7875680.1 PAS domain-containing protein [Hymenobacter sp. ASUV-10]